MYRYSTVYNSRSIRTIVWPFVIMSNPKDIREVLSAVKKKRSNAKTSLSGLAVEPRQIAGRIILQDGFWTPDPPESGRDVMWIQRVENGSQSMPPPNIVSMNLVEKHFTSFNLMFSYNLHARKYTWLCLLDMLAYWLVNVANMVFLFRNTFLI